MSTPSKRRWPTGFPNSTLLSHDLFEGILARAGLASDIEVVEEFPARYDVAALRQHRWARGDWQLLPWILGSPPAPRIGRQAAIPAIGRWKMLDNLRRTLSAPAAIVAFLVGWTLPFQAAAIWTVFLLLTIVLPTLTADPRCRGPRTVRNTKCAAISERSASISGSLSLSRACMIAILGASGVADGRRDRANPDPTLLVPAGISSNGSPQRKQRSARGSIFSASIAAWPGRCSSPLWR